MDIFESVTGLRMNHAYIRIGGVDHGPATRRAWTRSARSSDVHARSGSTSTRSLLTENPIWRRAEPRRRRAVGRPTRSRSASPARCCARPESAADLRKDMPYCGYETYDFDVPVRNEADAYARYSVRLDEMRESMRDRRAVPRTARGARAR